MTLFSPHHRPIPLHDACLVPGRTEGNPERPLGPLSDLVATSLPAITERLRVDSKSQDEIASMIKGLLESHEYLVSRRDLIALSHNSRRTALLDLAMLEAVLRTHAIPIPEPLAKHLDELGAELGILPCLTYELIIRSNPLHDTRTFTGSAGERAFYQGHEAIEAELSKILDLLGDPVMQLAPEYALVCAKEHLGVACEIMGAFESFLTPEDFTRFRPYVDGNRNGLKGPSGLRSANLFSVAFAIMGEELMPRRMKIEKEIEYYPVSDIPRLEAVVAESIKGDDLFSRCRREGFPPSLSLLTQRLSENYLEFLTIHLAVVRPLLPAKAAGTAGTEGLPFLERGVERVQSALAAFTEERRNAHRKALYDAH